jgi:hypothetical protein
VVRAACTLQKGLPLSPLLLLPSMVRSCEWVCGGGIAGVFMLCPQW